MPKCFCEKKTKRNVKKNKRKGKLKSDKSLKYNNKYYY